MQAAAAVSPPRLFPASPGRPARHWRAAVCPPRLFSASPGRPARHRRAPSTVRMALREDGPSVAIVGATGAVGREFLRAISDSDFPYRSLRFLASERSAGKRLAFEDREYTVQDLAAPGAFDGVDIALFSAGGSVSRAVVVDNSSAFRMDSEVPLVIPEVNPEAMGNVRLGQGAIVANPNCSTIICLMAATPLHHHAKVLRMVVSTYQAASGAGAAAMEELKLQTQEVLEGKTPTCNIFKQQYAFNIFSHNAPVLENGYNEEEMKMVKETRKIWNDKDVKVTATCIRVPVMRAHAESVNLQFEKPIDEVPYKDDVAVGRLQQDLSLDVKRGDGGRKEVTMELHASISVSGDAGSLPTYGALLCLVPLITLWVIQAFFQIFGMHLRG